MLSAIGGHEDVIAVQSSQETNVSAKTCMVHAMQFCTACMELVTVCVSPDLDPLPYRSRVTGASKGSPLQTLAAVVLQALHIPTCQKAREHRCRNTNANAIIKYMRMKSTLQQQQEH